MWCHKCYGLAYSKASSAGTCPRGGTHDHARSADDALPMNVGSAGGQNQWSWCKSCQQLWWSGNGQQGRCSHSPIGGHSKDGSADYTLSHEQIDTQLRALLRRHEPGYMNVLFSRS
ncbi:hypothetical protein B0J15DRAFT_502857 [Fusarium solani]|uniref:Uncharacterized protein n=1 Tax=Fusarium solani TaxID=169388 RepID=A0A9P9K0X1_FUSSL|nr:uncharacterized protein B0J15DRAFT_502857 [Fusarium solani]KAH7239835.1 hypothetical protein B0J15DRAFT_502857 [Fusarium solani]